MLYTSELTNKSYKTIQELEAAEAELKAAEEAKNKEKEERQLDVVSVQDVAQAYLNLVAENNAKREELKKAEDEAYAAYKAELNNFAKKHNGYHLTYKQDGNNVEFKIEENRQQALIDCFEEQRKAMQKFFNGFWF